MCEAGLRGVLIRSHRTQGPNVCSHLEQPFTPGGGCTAGWAERFLKQDPKERTPSPTLVEVPEENGQPREHHSTPLPTPIKPRGAPPRGSGLRQAGLSKGQPARPPPPGPDVDTGGLTSAADGEGSPGRGCVTGAHELQLRAPDLRTRRSIRDTGCTAMKPVGLVESPLSTLGDSGAL